MKISWLAAWFIFEWIGLGAAPDLSELHGFKNVSLQMMIDQTFTFRRIFFEKLHHIQVLTFDINVQSGSGTLLLLQLPLPRKFATFTASSIRFRFHIPAYKSEIGLEVTMFCFDFQLRQSSKFFNAFS